MIREVIDLSVFLAAVGLFIFGLLRDRKVFNFLDAAGLYLPLLHLFCEFYRLMPGGIQDQYTSIRLYGLHLRFQNPTPLYALIADVGLFLFLKRLHTATHNGEVMRARFAGVVFASYLMLHASLGIVISVFENEIPVYLDLTMTQLTMAVYILLSVSIFAGVFFTSSDFKTKKQSAHFADGPGDDPKRLLSAAGLAVFYLMTTFLIYYLTRVVMVWKWPIVPVVSLADAYARLLYYMPVMVIAASALVWMRKNNEPIRPWFSRGRFSGVFVIGLLASMYYSFELLVLKGHTFRGVEFWPPVIILSVLNAACEEIMYRLAFCRAIIRAGYSGWVALIVQSVAYSLIHFMVVGAVLGLLSLFYGFILGLIVQRSKSVSQAMVCHFIIDIGCIGMPLLRL
jgi:membrane protease YdiL (CAAX protease family)